MFCGRIFYYETLDSTNRLARDLSESGADQGTVVVAEYQSAGKGRMNRKWVALPRSSLLFSVILRPRCKVDCLFLINAVAALGIVYTMRSRLGLNAMVKWPNDVYVGGKKLAGVLGEFSLSKGILEYVVVGIGLNVHWAPDMTEEGAESAVCVDEISGGVQCRTRLLGSILRGLEKVYSIFEAGKVDSLLAAYRRNSAVLGRDINVIDGNRVLSCKAIDIMGDGTLVVVSQGGQEIKLRWGDVSLRL